MIAKRDVIMIQLTPAQIALARREALRAEIGGASCIIGDREERRRRLALDQFTGQLGQLAATLVLTGSEDPYRLNRAMVDPALRIGDRGGDIPGTNIEIKSSRMGTYKTLSQYMLPVRPRERTPNTVYVMVVVAYTDLAAERATAYILGWARGSDLPGQAEAAGLFKGAHVIIARDLNPIMPVIWADREE